MPRKPFDAEFIRNYEPSPERMELALQVALGLIDPKVCDRELSKLKAQDKKAGKAGAA